MADLTPELIAETALEMLDEQGESAFTIRRIADRLGVTPMALYNHVEDKATLAALVVDAAVASMKLGELTGDWRDDLIATARGIRKGALAHPAVAEVRRTYRVWTPSMLRLSERWLGLWRQSGLAPPSALIAARSSSLAIHGLLAEEVLLREVDMPDLAHLAQLPDAKAMFATKIDHEKVFNLTVAALIEGLYARLA